MQKSGKSKALAVLIDGLPFTHSGNHIAKDLHHSQRKSKGFAIALTAITLQKSGKSKALAVYSDSLKGKSIATIRQSGNHIAINSVKS